MIFGVVRVLGVPGVLVVLGVMRASGTAYGTVGVLMAAHSAVNPLNAQSPRDPGVQFIPFSPYSLSDQESPGNAAEHCPCFMKC